MRERRKVLTGRVVSDKMDKTVVVQVTRQKRHRLYGKVIRTVRKYKAHDEHNRAAAGDVVRIKECRPMSREKRWVVTHIIERTG